MGLREKMDVRIHDWNRHFAMIVMGVMFVVVDRDSSWGDCGVKDGLSRFGLQLNTNIVSPECSQFHMNSVLLQ